HSHDRTPYYALKRAYADHYQAAELFGWIMVPSPLRLLRAAAWGTRDALPYVLASGGSLAERLKLALLTPLFMISVALGQFLGPRVLLSGSRHRWLARLDRQLRRGV